jgi:5'-deoxynucleotidase YfbR-like HD superfamily hydrolase
MFDREHRTLAHVPRWPIMRVNRRQSVAEHSYFVALYSMEIAQFVGWDGDGGRLAVHALTHDLDEIVTGDWPSPVKRAMKSEWREDLNDWTREKMDERSSKQSAWHLDAPNPKIKAIVKLADYVEALLYLGDECAMGNRNASPMIDYIWPRFNKFYSEFTELFEINGSRLLDKISYAFENAKNGHDKVVSE